MLAERQCCCYHPDNHFPYKSLFDHRHCTRWVEAGSSCSSTQIRWTGSYGQLLAYLDPTIYLKNCWKAVNVQLQWSLHQHGILNSFQSGFRRHHSTYTAVTYFCDIRRSTDVGKLTGALFIDLKKAFDTVPYDDLICKLRRFGLEENSLTWLTSYLTYGTHAVCVRDELSSPMPVLSGIPQGSILGRVPFTLYINDLPSCIQHHDDTVIYLLSTSTSDIELKLNLDLANLLCFFAHSDWLSNQWISCTIHWFTSSSPERATPNSHKLRANKMPSWFAAITNKEIWQLIKQTVPEIHEEGDKARFRSFNR